MNFKLVLQSNLVAILLLFVFGTTARPLECSILDTIRPTFLGKTCLPQELFVGEKDCFSAPYQFCVEATDDPSPNELLNYKLEIDLKTDSILDTVGLVKCYDFSSGFAFGKHTIKITVTDQAGNFSNCTKVISVVDTIKPEAKARFVEATLSYKDCIVTISAVAVNAGSKDNCSDSSKLRYRLRERSNCPMYDLKQVLKFPTELTFDAWTQYAREITLFVIDESGNWSSIDTVVFIRNDFGCEYGCYGTNWITLTQKDEFGKTVKLVPTTTLVLDQVDRFQFDTSASMLLVRRMQPYNVELRNNHNVSNGVTTSDLIAINKHILRTEIIGSPYQIIAADINADGKITTADLVELRKIILHLKDAFDSNTSYRFVNSKYDFDNPTLQLNTKYHINLDARIFPAPPLIFIAVKIGDVNNSINTGFQEAGARGSTSFVWNVPALKIVKGAVQQIKLQFDPDFDGMQTTIMLNPRLVRIVGVEGLLESNFNGNFFEKGLIPISLLRGESDGSFSVTIEGIVDCEVESVVSLTDEILPSISYSVNSEQPIVVRFTQESVSSFALLQNRPNPFNGKTLIGMVFPEATAATMTIFDATGRTLKVIQGDYAKGYHEETIDQADLKATGILTYRLTTDKYSATKQMIIAQ